MTRLDPPIPVYVLMGLGFGHAYGWTDYTQDHDRLWLVCIAKTGEFWDIPQSQIRGVENFSLGRQPQV